MYDVSNIRDREYENAVKDGNENAILKLLEDEFISKTPSNRIVGRDGRPILLFHGTEHSFEDKFDKTRIGYHTKSLDHEGFFFVDDESYAESQYSSGYDFNSMKCLIYARNIVEFETNGRPETMWDEYPNEFSDNTIREGKDCVIIHGFTEDSENDGNFSEEEWEEMQLEKSRLNMYVVFNPHAYKACKANVHQRHTRSSS